jgi:hypothetical protein
MFLHALFTPAPSLTGFRRMLQRFLPTVLLTLAVAACSTPPPDEQEQAAAASEQRAEAAAKPAADGETATVAPPADAGACDDVQAQWLVGKTPAEADLLQAQKDAGASTTRVLKPGQAVTMEFRADRLNAEVDEKGVVSSVRCG